MRLDVRSALRGAVDIRVPEIHLGTVYRRNADTLVRRARTTLRSLMACGALFIGLSLVIAESVPRSVDGQVAMHTAVPAPEPIPT